MPDIKYLMGNPWPYVKWAEMNKPAIIVDGELYSLNDLEKRSVEGDLAYVVGSNDKNIELICSRLSPVLIHFYEMRVSDLAALNSLKRLTHLAIRWNTKVKDLSPISTHKNLNTLIIEDTPKISSIAPLSKLDNLKYLDYSGGIWNKNTADSLEPISELQYLEFLVLNNIKVEDGSLKPIAECKKLKKLDICNKFKTEEFAFLAARMPSVECDMFKAYVELNQKLGEHDVMVVGSRKPFLNSTKDKAKLEKYKLSFSRLVDEHSLNKRVN